ncbi:hypothetical protein NliqN6_2894 [Naganishia liquefaciens]|uniref:DNA polymerase delta subunit 4 n=1 Tax=Naganishia liquefaciens TaxID=104408 RepID=A0A8H3TSQ5_9TREE|nr:hypothetical protein NliqN6_2894 [Naganishia liquefaciens]
MPPKRTASASTLDLSRASPVIESPAHLGNDAGSSTKGVGTRGKSKLVRGGSGSQQGLLSFSSKKNTPVTPEKRKTVGGGMKRKMAEVQDWEEGKALHPLFALARKGEELSTVAESSAPSVDADVAQTTSINGISGVPVDAWDPLLLGTSVPSKSMEQHLNIHNIPSATLDSTANEQTPETDDLTAGERIVKGLAVRKAMLRADEKIKTLREGKGSAAVKGAAAKAKAKKGGLDPGDKRWSKVYKAAWKSMGGDDIAPIHTTSKTHTKIHHILRVFDLSPEYGPCVGISRLARWERAKAWGLEPPEEIREILETQEGAEDVTYRETVFEGTGIYCPTA